MACNLLSTISLPCVTKLTQSGQTVDTYALHHKRLKTLVLTGWVNTWIEVWGGKHEDMAHCFVVDKDVLISNHLIGGRFGLIGQ